MKFEATDLDERMLLEKESNWRDENANFKYKGLKQNYPKFKETKKCNLILILSRDDEDFEYQTTITTFFLTFLGSSNNN